MTADRMKIAWSDHALARAKERGPAWGLFRALVERAVESREWDSWYEIDPREGRGMRENLVVCATAKKENTYAVVRHTNNGAYLVVSVLTQQQHDFNARTLWFRTPEGARAEATRAEAEARAGLSPSGRPLTYNPFERLLVSKK